MIQTINKPDFGNAEREAYALLKTSKATIFPIKPLDLILSRPDCKVQTYAEFAHRHNIDEQEVCDLLDSNDAATWEKNGNKIIFYNQNISSHGRIRFTLAHELGHIVLGHIAKNPISPISCRIGGISDEQYDIYEKEANYFAKRLLVPLPIITKLTDTLNTHSIDAYDISSVFETSLQTAIYIISNLQNAWYREVDEEMCEQFDQGIKAAKKSIEYPFNNDCILS